MWNKIWGGFVLLLVLSVLAPPIYAQAAPELKATVTAGLDGKAKYGRGAPVTIVVENTGTPFSGDLIVDLQQTYDSGVGEAFPLDIGTGETKTVTFIIPSINDYNMQGPNTKTIHFFEGGWRKGKELDHKGAKQIITALYYDDVRTLVAFSSNLDRLAALRGVRFANISTTQLIDASKIGAVKFPTEKAGWEAADVILVDEYPIADMNENEQKALLDWVRGGGILVFGGSDQAAAEAGPLLAEQLPLTLSGNATIDPAVLNTWAGSEKFDKPVPTAIGTLTPGAKALYKDGSNVIAAVREVGNGSLIQTAFSIGDEPFSALSGTTQWWKVVLEGALTSNANMGGRHYDNPIDNLRYTVGDTNELFPSFKVSAPALIGLIILYIILIIPVLYIILKKRDKREHAWWIVPSIAVLTSVLLFAFGAKDRIGKPQLQQTAVLDVTSDGTLEGYFVETVLSNRSGDFTFSAPGGTTLMTMGTSGGMMFGSGVTEPYKKAILEKSATGSTLHLRKIGYWNLGTFAGKTAVKADGNFAADLTVTNKELTGTVTNNFAFALKDIRIWSGTKPIKVGDLGPGETTSVKETLKTTGLIAKRTNPQVMGMPPATSDDLIAARKESASQFADNLAYQRNVPMITGYTDTPLVDVKLENEKNVKMSALSLIMQPVDAKVELTGAFSVDDEVLDMKIISKVNNSEAYTFGYQENMYYFEDQSYIQSWKLPETLHDSKYDWKTMELSKMQADLYEVSIWNNNTQQYESLGNDKKVMFEDVSSYMDAEGTVKIRLDFGAQHQGAEARIPQLKLDGEVVK